MLNNVTLRILGILILPLVWLLTADLLQLASPLLLPKLADVIARFYQLVTDGTLWHDFYSTFLRWLAGYSLGVFAGILCGLIIGLSTKVRITTEFLVEFFRAMPVTAIFPLFLLVFGIADSSKIAMAFTPTFLLMLVNTSYGVTLSDPGRRRMAQVFGATKFQIFRYVVIFDALPQIFVGLRMALAQSLIVTVVSEMFIGTDYGLGQRVYDSYLTSSIPTLYALLIVLGILGYTSNKIIMALEAKFVFWTGK